MDSNFLLRGGKELSGEIAVRGSKNSALPAIAASLLTSEPVTLENVPDIDDVRAMLSLAEGLGVSVSFDARTHTAVLEAKEISNIALDPSIARKLRGSVLFAGSLLGRAREARLPYPGGDAIGARPLTAHFSALKALGVAITENGRGAGEGGEIIFSGSELRGGEAVLEETSVTATENALLASVLAPGRTVIRLAAAEPHVQELMRLLVSMGAKIAWTAPSEITVEGFSRLGGAKYRLNPDELEVSSFAALAASTRSSMAVRGAEPRYLDAVFLQLRKMGVEFRLTSDALVFSKPRKTYQGFRIQSGLYPKLGSDHLPPFAVLATQAEGTTLIHEWLYEGRLRYIEELQKMGANASVLDPHRAVITGPTPLWGREISGLDIRSGMTMVIAGLVAEGETRISEAGHLDRGYERIDERLRGLGADIKRV